MIVVFFCEISANLLIAYLYMQISRLVAESHLGLVKFYQKLLIVSTINSNIAAFILNNKTFI